MNAKDDFKVYQKLNFPPLRGKRNGKRSIYGCPCCWKLPLNLMKKFVRSKAKNALKIKDRSNFQYFCR